MLRARSSTHWPKPLRQEHISENKLVSLQFTVKLWRLLSVSTREARTFFRVKASHIPPHALFALKHCKWKTPKVDQEQAWRGKKKHNTMQTTSIYRSEDNRLSGREHNCILHRNSWKRTRNGFISFQGSESQIFMAMANHDGEMCLQPLQSSVTITVESGSWIKLLTDTAYGFRI